eukprot:6723759-Pyramimonas_sp.AAC.1
MALAPLGRVPASLGEDRRGASWILCGERATRTRPKHQKDTGERTSERGPVARRPRAPTICVCPPAVFPRFWPRLRAP